MVVTFVYNRTFTVSEEFEDGTSIDQIEEYYEDWLFNCCLPLEVFDTEGMTDEDVDFTLREYGQWYIED